MYQTENKKTHQPRYCALAGPTSNPRQFPRWTGWINDGSPMGTVPPIPRIPPWQNDGLYIAGWWFQPTQLKHMRKSNWLSSPRIGMKIKKMKPPSSIGIPYENVSCWGLESLGRGTTKDIYIMIFFGIPEATNIIILVVKCYLGRKTTQLMNIKTKTFRFVRLGTVLNSNSWSGFLLAMKKIGNFCLPVNLCAICEKAGGHWQWLPLEKEDFIAH